jgi:hypothetical protein
MKMKIYRIIVLPVGLYGCQAWPVTFRKEHRLRVFQNRVLRNIFGPKGGEVTGELRRLHHEELHAVYSSLNIIWVIKSRRMIWARHVARMTERRAAYGVLVMRHGERDDLKGLGLDGRTVLKWIFTKWDGVTN